MTQKRPFDLSKLDFDGIRLRRRRKLIIWSLPAVILIGLVAIKLLSIPFLSYNAHGQYTKGLYDKSSSWLNPLYVLNIIEPFKLPYNQGNAHYKKGDFSRAEKLYRNALETVPEDYECSVRINLALAIEAQADVALGDKKFDEAVLWYDDAKAVLHDGEDSCGVRFNELNNSSNNENGEDGEDEKESGKSDSETAQQIEQRIREKSENAKRSRNGDEGKSGEDDSQGKSDPKSTQEKIDELERNSTEAQRKRSERQRAERNRTEYGKNERGYDAKNW